jgi:hypothetical protein
MNQASYRAVSDGLAAWGAAEQRNRDAAMQKEMLKWQIERDSRRAAVEEALKRMDLEHGATQSAADRVSREGIAERQIEADRKARSSEAFWRAQGRMADDNPTGARGDLLAAEVDAARANAARLQQQAAAGAPSTLDADLGKVDEWARASFRANQALQQAQQAGNAEAVAMAQARLARLQSLGQKYGSEKPEQRMVKVKVPFMVDGKEAGFREWEEPYDPKVHQMMPAGGGQTPAGIVPLNSVEALKQRMAAGAR